MDKQKRFVPPVALIPLAAVMGLIAFSSVANSPRFESFHTPDIIRLMTAGAALAITVFGTVLILANSSDPTDDKAP